MLLQTSFHGRRGFQTAPDCLERHVERERDRRRGERIEYVVATGQRQRDLGVSGGRNQREPRLLGECEDLAIHIGSAIEPEAQHAPAAGENGKHAGERIVHIDQRDPMRRQGCIQCTFGFGDAFERAHALKMGRRNVVDEADFGPRDGGQIGDVSRLAGTHFEYRVVGILGHGEQSTAAGRFRC